jgi:hypothetical protein
MKTHLQFSVTVTLCPAPFPQNILETPQQSEWDKVNLFYLPEILSEKKKTCYVAVVTADDDD